MDTYGIISLIPVAVVIVTAILSKRAMESLVLGTFVAAIIFAKGSWWGTWLEYSYNQIGNSAYYILLFGMFGVLIRLLDESGSAMGFADIATKYANSPKKTQLFAWVLGIVIFVDDYLNALAVGIAMRDLADKWKIPREKLAYIVNSTGAAVCVLIPVTAWAIFYAGQIEETKALEGMSGLSAYLHTIPFMLYAWLAVLVVPLFVLGIIPTFGAMKKAEKRAQETGRVFPDHYYEEGALEESAKEELPKSSALNFIIPMLVCIAVCIYTKDVLTAMVITTPVAAIMLMIQKKLTIGGCCDALINGFKDMLYIMMLVIAAFVLQDFNDALGLTPYVIGLVEPIMSPALLPVLSFVVVAALAFCTGSFWGVGAITLPIIVSLAASLDANIYLAIATVICGSVFGSHACFYSDAVTVTCASIGIKNMEYAKTAVPLILVPAGLSIIGFIIMGFVF